MNQIQMAKMQFLSQSDNGLPVQEKEKNEVSWQLQSSTCHHYDWVKTSLPFICKVIHHVHELEEKTEIWFRQFTASVKSETQARNQSSDKLNENSQSDLTFTNPCIRDVHFERTEHDQTTTLHEQARMVLSEITGLMEQLETECQKTNEGLKMERERVTTLEKNIDQLSLWWMKELPEAVQKEYEVYSQEIYELELHVESKTSHLQKLQNQVNNASILNQRMQEEINLVKKLEDHLKEKLDLERKTINDIVPNQKELTEIYKKVGSDLKKVQLDFDDLTTEAWFEQNTMHKELLSIENKTAQLNKDIIRGKTMFEMYTTQEQKIRDQLGEAEKSYESLTNELIDLEVEKNVNENKIKQLKPEVANKYAEITILRKSCIQIEQTIEDETQIGNSELSHQQKELDRKLQELMNLESINKELELDIEIFNSNIKESRQARSKMRKEMRQIQKAVKLNSDKLTSMKKQLSQVEKTLNAVRTKLVTLKKTISDQEDQLKDQTVKLKKKIKDEMIQLTKLQDKVKLDAAELTQFKENSNKKKKRALNKVVQVEKVVENIETKFKELEALYLNLHEVFLMLNNKLNELKESQESLTKHHENEKRDLQNELTDDQNEYLDCFNLLNYILRNMDTLQENILQKQTLRTMLLKDTEKYKNIIEDLQSILDLVEFKHSSATNLISNFKSELAFAEKRLTIMEEGDRKLLHERREKRKEVRAMLASALIENGNRTAEYKQLQGTYLDTKSKLADTYYERLKTEECIKDYLQLSALHTRMHKALVDYSRQRGLYSQAELATFQALSRENAQKIIAVQGEMSKSIQRMSTFLQSLTDTCEPKEDTENKQCNQGGIIKDKKCHAVQVMV
ncbi:coiled-coil domain-containing protein 178 isoform X2 [Narcine bancroftii]|uniref:coiled-coil domain-containing protein 178 isoform X2 n=1 Tax=Narcine bancroftii TaxID=1343680 RepID=UPI003831773E